MVQGQVPQALRPETLSTEERPMPTIAAQPYEYTFEPASLALVIIDMQRDFIEPGGFGAALGNDVRLLAPIVPTVGAPAERRSANWA